MIDKIIHVSFFSAMLFATLGIASTAIFSSSPWPTIIFGALVIVFAVVMFVAMIVDALR